MSSLTFWQGSREFVTTTLVDEKKQPAETLQSYEVAFIPIGTSISAASWTQVVSYDGGLGMWVEPTTPAGTYAVFGRAGSGAPDEQTIRQIGFFSVRGR